MKMINEAVRALKNGKAEGLDEVKVRCLKMGETGGVSGCGDYVIGHLKVGQCLKIGRKKR